MNQPLRYGKEALGMTSKQQGFNLIEVLISFLLIGVGALGLVKLQVYVEQKADFAVHSVEALHLAEKKLEWFRTRGASGALSTITPANFDSDLVTGSDASHPIYTLNWVVASPSLSGALKTIEIETHWQGRLGENESITLTTMISKYSEFD